MSVCQYVFKKNVHFQTSDISALVYLGELYLHQQAVLTADASSRAPRVLRSRGGGGARRWPTDASGHWTTSAETCTHTHRRTKTKTINLTNYVHKSFKNLVWTGPITILMFQLFNIYIINYMITMGVCAWKNSCALLPVDVLSMQRHRPASKVLSPVKVPDHRDLP